MADEMKRPFGGVYYHVSVIGKASGTLKWDGGAFGGSFLELSKHSIAVNRFGVAGRWHSTFEAAAQQAQGDARAAYENARLGVLAYEAAMPQEHREEIGPALLWHAFNAGYGAGRDNLHDVDDEWKAYLSELKA